ncbi:Lysine-specific permease [Zancudomyces culisetae]|nr:Lysine-specific permease [Zancudomyces culisetae]|eukprot:OMH83616.1 Lysine-specific permease [Zancudomyces culisetae]
MGLVLPYNDPSLSSLGLATVKVAPFTQVFSKAGIAAAPHIVNAVVLSSVLSSCNTSMYSSSRMVYALYHNGQAPKFLARVSKSGVPYTSLTFAVFLGLLFVLLSALLENAYVFLVNMGGIFGMVSWVTIVTVHIAFRRAYKVQGYDVKNLPYRAPLYPFGSYFAFLLLAVIIIGQVAIVSTRDQDVVGKISTLAGLPLFAFLFIGYKIIKRTKFKRAREVDLETDASTYISYETETA